MEPIVNLIFTITVSKTTILLNIAILKTIVTIYIIVIFMGTSNNPIKNKNQLVQKKQEPLNQ